MNAKEMTIEQLSEEIEYAETMVIPDLLVDIEQLKAVGDEEGVRMHVDILREVRQNVREWKDAISGRIDNELLRG